MGNLRHLKGQIGDKKYFGFDLESRSRTNAKVIVVCKFWKVYSYLTKLLYTISLLEKAFSSQHSAKK